MKLSAFDLNRARALHFLLEEAHVGRAAVRLGITPAAASNALRRLREDFADPLLAQRGRGLIRTRMGEELRGPAREVLVAAETLLRTAKPFDAAAFKGELPIALADHVAAMLLEELDRLARTRAPLARLVISAIPLQVAAWLKTSGGVLVGPPGPFAAVADGDDLISEPFYADRYVCVMRRGHALAEGRLLLRLYAAADHVLVTPRGLTTRSEMDAFLEAQGLARQVVRVVPSFHLAVPIILRSDAITTMPERSARPLSDSSLVIKNLPVRVPGLSMRIISHPAHHGDGRTRFVVRLLLDALAASEAKGGSSAPG